MAVTKKRVFARVSSTQGDPITIWYQIQFHGFSKQLNAGPGECVLSLPLSFDYDGLDLKTGNDVEINVIDADSSTHEFDGAGTRLIYKGYISLVERSVTGPKETVQVHLLGYYTQLALDILKSGSQTTLYSHATTGLTTSSGSQAAADIGLLFRTIIDRYRAETVSPKLYYNGQSDIPNTGTSVTYTFQRKTYRQSLDTLKALAPEGVYWYADEHGRITFQEKPSSPTHTFVFGKHFTAVRIEQSIEKLRNVLLLWDGASLHKQYKDDLSIATYGRRAEALNDYGIADSDAADEMGAKFLAENKEPETKVICTILDNADGVKGYDIENIQPGDTCSFVGFSSTLTDMFRDNMLITRVAYKLDAVEIEVELGKSGLFDVQARQSREISDIGNGGLGVPATYS
jgi:hypothetical protein